MQFALQHIFDRELVDSPPDRMFISFSERRKCLNHIFWTTFQALERGEKIMICVSNEEELEYLNYFISRYRLQDISLVINDSVDQQLSYIADRLYTPVKIKNTENEYSRLTSEIDAVVDKLTRNLRVLHEPGIGKTGLVEAAIRTAGPGVKLLKSTLYPAMDLDSYRNKRQVIQKMSEIYKPEFRYNDNFKIFDKTIFNEYDAGLVLGILKELSEDAERLLVDFEEFSTRVMADLQKEQLTAMEETRTRFRKLCRLEKSRGQVFDDTRLKKIAFESKAIFSLLGASESYTGNSEADIPVLEELIRQNAAKSNSDTQASLNSVMNRLNANNSVFDPSELFKRCRQLMEKIDDSSIFSKSYSCFCFSFLRYREWLNGIIELLDKSVYLLSFESDMLQWYIEMNSISSEDRFLVGELMDSRTDWLDCFERAYLRSFVKARTADIDNAEKLHNELLELWDEFEAFAQNPILESVTNPDVKKSSTVHTADTWEQLIAACGKEMSTRFPLIAGSGKNMDTNTFKAAGYDRLILLNVMPGNIDLDSVSRLFMASYKEEITRKMLREAKKIEGCEILSLGGVAFNINRSAQYLNQSELANMAHFLAQGIERFNPDYRIFQTKAFSLISLLGYNRNQRLISFAEGLGIKEIFSHDSEVRLLPGIFNDKERKVIVLVEDMLLDGSTGETVVQQKLFLEDLRTTGCSVISVDNYKLLTRGNDGLEQSLARHLGVESPHLVSV